MNFQSRFQRGTFHLLFTWLFWCSAWWTRVIAFISDLITILWPFIIWTLTPASAPCPSLCPCLCIRYSNHNTWWGLLMCLWMSTLSYALSAHISIIPIRWTAENPCESVTPSLRSPLWYSQKLSFPWIMYFVHISKLVLIVYDDWFGIPVFPCNCEFLKGRNNVRSMIIFIPLWQIERGKATNCSESPN